MKPYYKEGGLFYLLEKLSDWIDDEMSRPKMLKIIFENIDHHINFHERIKRMQPKTRIGRLLKREELWNREYAIDNLIDLYNREKYWWMRKK
jgi:hypothetical protein